MIATNILEQLLNPGIVWIFIPLAGIALGGVIALSAMFIKHRERMAKIGMGIDPDDSHLTAQSLTNSLGCAGDGTNSNGVVAAQSQDELAVLGVFVDLGAQALGDGADGAGLLHVSVVGIFGWNVFLVVVDDVIVVDVVFEVFAELGEESGFDKGHWGGFDAFLHL